MTELKFRTMSRGEVGTLVAWSAAEGWNPGLHDAESFWKTDPEAFIAAELDGELIGGGAIVRYSDAFGFMGLFIVRPEFRGRGYGGRLWYQRRRQLRERLKPGSTIGMDGVFEMQDWYAVGGFKLAHRTIRFEAVGQEAPARAGVVPLDTVSMDEVIAYDRSCFPAPRQDFLKTWVRQPDSRALAVVDAGTLRGFGVARRCEGGAKIGPLFADDRTGAEALYEGLAGLCPGEPVYIDMPENNAAAMAVASTHGMVEVFGTARMYAGPAPNVRHERIFGNTTFELG